MDKMFNDKLKAECSQIGVELEDKQIDQFYHYYQSLIEKNKVMNLTTITEMEEVVTKHFVDSISLIKAVPDLMSGQCSLIDVGTGAGFPGIPIKIVFPDVRVTLLDSLNKRVKYLYEVIEGLGLSGVKAIHGRAEDLGHDGSYREKFDLCTSRAVANISTLSEYCLPFVKVGGQFISYKSGNVEDELNSGKHALHLLGGKTGDIIKFYLPGNEIERSLVVINKIDKTNKRYPRKAGVPSKEPL